MQDASHDVCSKINSLQITKMRQEDEKGGNFVDFPLYVEVQVTGKSCQLNVIGFFSRQSLLRIWEPFLVGKFR